jgi:hypothetical protein
MTKKTKSKEKPTETRTFSGAQTKKRKKVQQSANIVQRAYLRVFTIDLLKEN